MTYFIEIGEKNYLLTIGATGIILSHNITSLLVVIMCIVFVICDFKKLKSTRIWKQLIINAIFIITIVAFFYIPLIENITKTEYYATSGGMSSNEFCYKQALYPYQLIFGKFQWGSSLGIDEGISNEMNFSLGIILIVALVMTPITFKKVKMKKLYIVTLLIGIVFAIGSTVLCPWEKMPSILVSIQFPWRLLIISTVLLSIIAGVNITYLTENFEMKDVFFVITIIMIYTYFNISYTVEFNTGYDETYVLNTEKIESYTASKDCSGYEYLPIKARNEYLVTRSNEVIILSGNAEIYNEEKNGLELKFSIKNNQENVILELPYIYYQGYNAEIDGKKVELKESENGFLCLELNNKINGEIYIKYEGTFLGKIGGILSCIGTLLFIIYIVYSEMKKT